MFARPKGPTVKHIHPEDTDIAVAETPRQSNPLKRRIIAIVAAVIVVALVATGGLWYTVWGGRYMLVDLRRPKAIAATSNTVRSAQSFAYESAVEILNEDDNVNYSPVSLQMALLIASKGAQGDTLVQLQQALNSADLTDEDLNSLYLSIAGKRDGDSRLDAANSLWALRDLSVNSDYSDTVQQIFGTQVKRVNAFNSATNSKMSTWVSDQTHGVLKPEIDLSENTGLAILSALYANGHWSSPFDVELTEKAEFQTLEGSSSNVDFMHKTITIMQDSSNDSDTYTKGDGWQRVDLTFDNGGRMKILLPDDNTRFKALLTDSAALHDAFQAEPNAQDGAEINVSLPKFTISNTLDSDSMIEAMRHMGVADAFDASKADFSQISDSQMFIGSIVQGTRIEVSEVGAEAAAYTQIGMMLAILPTETIEFNADHPFLFELDSPDGLPLFVGSVVNL